jgi:hypothetical protein
MNQKGIKNGENDSNSDDFSHYVNNPASSEVQNSLSRDMSKSNPYPEEAARVPIPTFPQILARLKSNESG